MRLLIYKALTQAIILLARLRAKAHPQWRQVRLDRCFDVLQNEQWSCCDCGLVHEFVALGEDVFYRGPEACNHKQPHKGYRVVGHAYPVRPKGYDYRMRLGACRPSLAQEAAP